MSTLTGLQRPPDGWSSALVRAQRGERIREKTLHVDRSSTGRLPHSVAAADLPTLVQGRDTLPKTCPSCGSGFLGTEPPLGGHRHGSVTCNGCGQQLCWLAQPIGALRVQPAATPPVTGKRPAIVARAPQPVRTDRYAWTEGCGRGCSVAYGHDPLVHEAYGRQSAVVKEETRPTGQLVTGPLLIDFDMTRVRVGGELVALTATEEAILFCLAARAGQMVATSDITRAVWEREPTPSLCQTLRVQASRLRIKLGAARSVFETLHGRGYRLIVEEAS